MALNQTIIGPLVLKECTPQSILSRIRNEVGPSFEHLNRKSVTSLTLCMPIFVQAYGKLNEHVQNLAKNEQWIEKYQFLKLQELKCQHNQIPTLNFLHLFSMPKLDILNLSEFLLSNCSCYIENLQGLSKCYFPQLRSLILFNNRIISLKAIRKLKAPFLSDLIIDSNHITDLKGLSELSIVFLTNLQINNNQLNSLRPLLKCNFPNLMSIKAYDVQFCIDRDWKIIEQMLKKKIEGFQ